MKSKGLSQSQEGFSLLEVVAALAIISLGLLFFLNTQTAVPSGLRNDRDRWVCREWAESIAAVSSINNEADAKKLRQTLKRQDFKFERKLIQTGKQLGLRYVINVQIYGLGCSHNFYFWVKS